MRLKTATKSISDIIQGGGWINATYRSLAIAIAMIAAPASAAWYDSPSIVKKVPLAVNASGTVDPHFMNKSEDDSLLLVNLQASGDNAPTVLIDMKALADKSTAVNDVTIRRPVAKPSEGYGAEWKGGAVSAKLGIALMGGGLSSETCALTTGDGKWVKGIGLLPLSTSNGMKTDGLDFSADSSFVYSTEYGGGDRGKIAQWTYDKASGRLVFVKDFKTSLTRIRNISVYTVGGKELVYCGEGDGASAAAKVVAIDVSGDTWTETAVSSDIAGLTGDITNVKLSNENDANPVMYVLCDSGKLAVCRLASDGLSVSETVKTFDAAALHALAGGTTTAKFRNFEVAKDGKTAFLINRVDTHNASLCVLAASTSAYIESDGTQFMNTGYYPGPKTKIEVDFQLTEAIKGKDCIFGNYGDPNFSVLLYAQPETQSKKFQFCGKDGGWQGQNLNVLVDTTRHTMVIDVPKKKGTMSAPDGTVQSQADFNSSWTYTKTAAWPIAFFASCNNASGTSAHQGAKVKIYGARIWELDDNGETYTLLHDYSPAIKNGIAGLLDAETGTFLYDTRSNGTWTFAYGGDVPTIDDDPYVESDGTSAINLGVSASPKLKIVLDYALLEGNELQSRLLGEDSVTSAPRISIYINASGNISLASGDGWVAESTGVATNTARRTAIIDNVAGKWAFMTGVTTNWSVSGKADLTKCATRPLALFGNTNADDGSVFKQCTKMKVYGLKIWAGDTLLRDLAPRCIDGTAGFEDLATGRFYTCGGLTASANAPTELSGASKEGDAFIESDGSFYSVVNTYYFVKPSTKIEIDYALASIVSGAGVLGGYGADAGISTILWCNGTTKFVLEMRDGNHDSTADKLFSPAIPLDLARHTAVFDGPGRHLSLSSHDGTIEAESVFHENWTLNTAKANWPVLLFGFATDAYGHNQQRAKARIYGVKFYENGSPVLTLTPAVKGGVAGFKDDDGNFYSGDGLIAGGAVETLDEDPYVENPDGGRYFDTGYYVTSNTCIVCDFMLLMQHASPQQFPFEAGTDQTAKDDGKMFMRIYGNGSAGQGDIAYACGQSGWTSLNVPYAPHVRRQVTVDAYNLATKIETAGQTIRETTITASGRVPEKSNNTLKLLCNSAMNANSCKARLYGVQIFEEGTLVRDYVPICQGGSYALLDKVQGKVLAKASNSKEFTGYTVNNDLNDAFFVAPMRSEDAYIESDGTQAIDLGYLTTPNTRYEIDYKMTEIVGQMRPFGEAGGDLSAELYIQGTATGSGNVAFGVGDSWKGQYTNTGADLNRHVAVLDLANRACGYSGYKMFAFTSDTVCSKTATNPIWIFAKGGGDGSHSNRAKMRLYAFRIYESGVLVHEYLPYKNGDTVGLYDTMTGDVKLNSVNGANAFAYGGGMGYGKFAGVKTVLTTDPVDTVVKPNKAATLSAFAPGAIRYVWTRNGEVLAGAAGPEITVVWESPKKVGGTPVYGVTPVFLKDGVEVLGEEASAEVTMMPLGMVLILR